VANEVSLSPRRRSLNRTCVGRDGFVSGHRFSDASAIRITTAARKHPDIVYGIITSSLLREGGRVFVLK